MSYNILIPLELLGIIVGVTLLGVALHYILIRKVTYTTGELKQKNSYYEPREWAIILTVIILILLMGFVK